MREFAHRFDIVKNHPQIVIVSESKIQEVCEG